MIPFQPSFFSRYRNWFIGIGVAAEVVGLRPREFFLRERQIEILEAMVRYAKAGLAIPSEWLEELRTVFSQIYPG